MRHPLISACAAVALSAAPASAQLVFGTTTPTAANPAATYLDVATGTTTTLWPPTANTNVNGLAADEAGRKIYSVDAARLNVWNYGAVGAQPTFIAGLFRSNGTVTNATGFSGLAWANGKLYGATSFASATFTRGIYEIPTTPTAGQIIVNQVWAEAVNSGVLQLDGLEFNPADGLFYGVQAADNTATGGTLTRGLFSIDVFGTGAFTKVADFPAGRTRIDGLAIGGGRFWLTEQTGADNLVRIFPYNAATASYDPTITFALPDATNRASAATWAPGALVVPEPTTLGVIAASALLASRRRRSSCATRP